MLCALLVSKYISGFIIREGVNHLQNEQHFEIERLGDFMDWVDELRPEKCLFRGLPNQEHSIEASAWRRLTNEQDSNNIDKLLEINEGLIRDARLRGFDSKDDRKLSDLEILAELQHFRASTFLIDFTYSAQVALWFACQQRFKDSQNTKELSDGKVCAVFVNPDRIIEVTPELLNQDISFFFEANADGTYPLYRWAPGELNSRIPPQHSVFLFGTARTIKPDEECIILKVNKRTIVDSIEGFSQTTETTLFPDFAGFVQQRTQDRPYIPEGYESHRAAGYRAYRWEDYETAISYFDEIIHLNSTDADVYHWRGISKQSLRRLAEAIDDHNKAIELKDDDIDYYLWRGMAWVELAELDKAKDDLEKALELAELANDTGYMEFIQHFLRSVVFQIDEVDQWTPEMFKELVPKDIREHYDTRVGDEELYSLGADLQSLILQKHWKLERRFGRSYFVFCYGRRRVFGVNLFRNPRLAIWGTEGDKSKFSKFEPTYYPSHGQWVFPRGVTVENLSDILESVYNDVQTKEQITSQVSLF